MKYTKEDLEQAYQNGVDSVEVFTWGKCFAIGVGLVVGYWITITILSL